MAKYTPAGSGGTGTCAWGRVNPASAAMISWNAVHLPPNGGYGGSWYLVGQGIKGPVLLVGYYDALTQNSLTLPDGSGGDYETVNTIAAVETATGARIYDSTADCPSTGCTNSLAQVPGRLYAIDITSPTTANGTPTMTVAWSYSIEGPSGASPMVLPATSGAPVGDQIYFDGSGPACASPCSQAEHPTLFALKDNGTNTTQLYAADLTTLSPASAGTCPNPQNPNNPIYYGIQAASVLEAPESSGSDRNYSVWVHASCDPTLYRLDAQTGQQWSGAGAGTLDIPTVTGLSGYAPDSTMQTVTNSTSGHTVAFVGANLTAGSKTAYVLALDLETGNLLWKVKGPTNVPDVRDAPLHGQFPIAKTAAGGYVLIAPTAGAVDGSTILGIPLS
jgi:hypothetical protein